MKWLRLLKTLGPGIVAVLVPGVGPILAPIIVTAIAEAEKISGATGPEKKAAALELVKAGAVGVTIASGGKVVIDEAQAAATASSAIDTTVGVLNILRDATPDTGDAE